MENSEILHKGLFKKNCKQQQNVINKKKYLALLMNFFNIFYVLC